MKKYIRSGYVLIHDPTHHRAEENGLVYEHVVLAEKYLGRKLKPEEVVHHEDRNKANNSKENLFVFRTNADHSRYHKTGVMVEMEDGTYISPPEIRTCEYCLREYKYTSNMQGGKFCSKECYDKGQRRAERPSKEELYNLIINKSFKEIGRDYGLSDNAIRKWCKSYGLPYRKKDLKSIKQV